jgi:hypothetical protein
MSRAAPVKDSNYKCKNCLFAKGEYMRILIIVTALIIAFSFSGVRSLDAQVYTWTDEKGVKHYSDQPPEEAEEAVAAFPEYGHEETADKRQTESKANNLQKAIDIISQQNEKARQENEGPQQEAAGYKPPSKEEIIAAEKDKLERTIADLEKKPLDYFGSQKNKRVRIGYYKYRLETLMQDPDNYFENPEPFEGNIKNP